MYVKLDKLYPGMNCKNIYETVIYDWLTKILLLEARRNQNPCFPKEQWFSIFKFIIQSGFTEHKHYE